MNHAIVLMLKLGGIFTSSSTNYRTSRTGDNVTNDCPADSATVF